MRAIAVIPPAKLSLMDSKVKLVWRSKVLPNLYVLEFEKDKEDGVKALADEYARDGEVKALIHDPEDEAHAPTDFVATSQFLKVAQLKAGGRSGKGVIVAVLDTGIESAHPAVAGRVILAQDFTSDGNPEDEHGHGTWCASAVGGVAVPALGLPEGMAPGVSFINAKVLNSGGSGTFAGAMQGLEWAALNGAKVMSNSWGSGQNTPAIPEAFFEALKAQFNCIFVFSAGNSGPGPATVGNPGNLEAVISVGALDHFSVVPPTIIDFSSRGPAWDGHIEPDIMAPGVAILGAWVPSATRVVSGTSMACPHIAGMLALIAEAEPTITDARVRLKLSKTSIDLMAPGKDNDSGWGYPDAVAADNYDPVAPPGVYLPSDSPVITVTILAPPPPPPTEFPTTLSIASDKAQYEFGEVITLSGALTSPSEGGVGVPGKAITLLQNGAVVGGSSTGVGGSYTFTRTAPAAAGPVSYQSKFLGDA